MMERYVQISLAELLDMVSKKQFKDIYFKGSGNAICQLSRYNINIDTVHDRKWFKREVIE